jgi:gamma-glutamyl:cysteine ligase YbdK (ATP-grasp superfamily)
VIPEYICSFNEYKEKVIEKYSSDMAATGADELILHKDWINSRGVTFRFDRRALEIRVMDEQECIKSDVALSCFIRAVSRGLLQNIKPLTHDALVRDYNSIVKEGLNADTRHPNGRNARQVCQYLLKIARENASAEEMKYLQIVQKRIDRGNLSEIIRERVEKRAGKTDLEDALVGVYLELTKSLIDNKPYF